MSPTLAIFRNFDDSPIFYDGPKEISSLEQWLKVESFPSVFDFNERSSKFIFNGDRPFLVMLIDENIKENHVNDLEEFKLAAKGMKNKIISVTSGV